MNHRMSLRFSSLRQSVMGSVEQLERRTLLSSVAAITVSTRGDQIHAPTELGAIKEVLRARPASSVIRVTAGAAIDITLPDQETRQPVAVTFAPSVGPSVTEPFVQSSPLEVLAPLLLR